MNHEHILSYSRLWAHVGNPRLLEERMGHWGGAQRCVALNTSCASLLVLSRKCFCPCWGALVNYPLRLFASASAALHPQTNENWAQNVFLDRSSKTFLLRTEPFPRDTVAAACPASSLGMNEFGSSRWASQTQEDGKKKREIWLMDVFSKTDVAYVVRPGTCCGRFDPDPENKGLTGKVKPESVSGLSRCTSTPRHVRAGHQRCSPPSRLVRKLSWLGCNLSCQVCQG